MFCDSTYFEYAGSKLEDELEVKIFNRATKPIILTDVGKKILVQAKRITEEAVRMQDIVSIEKGLLAVNSN